MPKPTPTITLRDTPHSSLWILVWAVIFFVLINLLVAKWAQPKSILGRFDRLMIESTDNELRSVLDAIQQETHPHIVLVGDSVIWGIGINDPELTIAGQIEEVKGHGRRATINLGQPGMTFLDQLAITKKIPQEHTVLFFINPIWFSLDIEEGSSDELTRFDGTVSRELDSLSQDLAQCCNIEIEPPENEDSLQSALRRVLPLYGHRDLIVKRALRIQFSRAVHAGFGRLRQMQFGMLIKRRDMQLDPTRDEQELGQNKSVDPPKTRNGKILEYIATHLEERPNTHIVILPNAYYTKTDEHTVHMQSLEELFVPTPVINLSGVLGKEYFFDQTHLQPEGQARVAALILRSI